MKEKAKNPSSKLQWQLIEIRLMEKRSLVKLMRLVNMTNSLTVGHNGGFKYLSSPTPLRDSQTHSAFLCCLFVFLLIV